MAVPKKFLRPSNVACCRGATLVVARFARRVRRQWGDHKGRPYIKPAPLQSEHVKHGGVALFLEFRRVGQGALAQRARSRGDRHILLAVDLEAHGGAAKRVPTLIFHSCSSVLSSKAATVPSNRARNTRPPPVESVPDRVG